MKLAAAGFAIYFGIMRAMALQPAAIAPANFVWNTMWVLAAGATVLGFISDRTQDHALGDGHLLLIASSVVSSALLPPLAGWCSSSKLALHCEFPQSHAEGAAAERKCLSPRTTQH